MAFVKLDSDILNSTLWIAFDERNIFITALLMAEPYELREPMPQLAIDSFDETGFIVPSGWYGFVRSAGVGIVRQSCMDMAPGLRALAALGSPEGNSRTADFDGRRLVRIDGGFIVLNYMRYRERDHTMAERSKRYRKALASRRGEKQPRRDDDAERQDAVPSSSAHKQTVEDKSTPPRRDITQAEAEADLKSDLDLLGERDRVPPRANADLMGVSDLVNIWNTAKSQKQRACNIVNAERSRHARERLMEVRRHQPNDDERAFWLAMVQAIAANAQCNGENDRGWIADFDYLIRQKTWVTFVEKTGWFGARRYAAVQTGQNAPRTANEQRAAVRHGAVGAIAERDFYVFDEAAAKL